MKNNIDQELQRIEIPKDLHERSIIGVKKAKAEQQSRRFPLKFGAAAMIVGGVFLSVVFAFPSMAAQIPFINNVISYFDEETRDYEAFEMFSTDINLTEISDGTTIMIDNAVYDGTNVTISYAIETNQVIEENDIRVENWFDVVGANGMTGSDKITKIGDNQFVGLASFTPSFSEEINPEVIQVSWEPEAIRGLSEEIPIKGDWSFSFSLNRLEGNVDLLNHTVQNEDVTFTLQSIEYTDVSSVIKYNQQVTDELISKWESITPVFHITDDLGNVYMDGTSGGGSSYDQGKTFMGSSDFGPVKEEASKLYIQPIQIASLHSGKGHSKIILDTIVVDLNK